MAAQTVKATYSLDPETVRALERLARGWRVSKSEALRRAIRASVAHPPPDERVQAERALDALQATLALDSRRAGDWVETARAERRNASRRALRAAK